MKPPCRGVSVTTGAAVGAAGLIGKTIGSLGVPVPLRFPGTTTAYHVLEISARASPMGNEANRTSNASRTRPDDAGARSPRKRVPSTRLAKSEDEAMERLAVAAVNPVIVKEVLETIRGRTVCRNVAKLFEGPA